MMKQIKIKLLALGLTVTLASCSGVGSSYEPVIDGQKDNRYYGNLAACQNLSKQKKYASNRNLGAAAIGAGIGALATSKGDRGDIAAGTAAGAGIGSAVAGYGTVKARQGIVAKCMRGRGYRVVG